MGGTNGGSNGSSSQLDGYGPSGMTSGMNGSAHKAKASASPAKLSRQPVPAKAKAANFAKTSLYPLKGSAPQGHSPFFFAFCAPSFKQPEFPARSEGRRGLHPMRSVVAIKHLKGKKL